MNEFTSCELYLNNRGSFKFVKTRHSDISNFPTITDEPSSTTPEIKVNEWDKLLG